MKIKVKNMYFILAWSPICFAPTSQLVFKPMSFEIAKQQCQTLVTMYNESINQSREFRKIVLKDINSFQQRLRISPLTDEQQRELLAILLDRKTNS